jgi:hypothetical protein
VMFPGVYGFASKGYLASRRGMLLLEMSQWLCYNALHMNVY